jgi:hypothetical protein
MVVATDLERNEMRSIHERNFRIRKFDSESAGGTLKIINFEDLAAKCWISTEGRWLFVSHPRCERLGQSIYI